MTAEQFELLRQKSQPHQVFKLDWSSYYSIDYADIFLPKVQGYRAKALRLYDGGEFFKELRKTDRKVLAFKGRIDLHTLISYTYPKGTLAEERKSTVQVDRHEVCTFIEFDQQENIDVTFKLGSDFKNFVNQLYQDKKINSAATALENSTYSTTINEFRSHFKKGLVHDTMMRFVLNTMDIPVDEVVSVAPVYTKVVFDYITNYEVQNKYPVKIFFRKNQSQVLEDQNTLFPKNDEIYVWLIRDEEGIYDTDFVLLKLGVHVAQRFKTKELTEDDINTTVKEAIGNAGILHIIEREEIDESVHEALGDALLVAVTLEDLNSNPVLKEVFKADPSAYLLLKTMDFAASTIKDWKLADRHWNPKAANYFPLLSSDRVENAFLCGVINGIIDELAGIADAVSFLIKLSKSKTEYENFKTAIRKLLEEENLLELLVKGALKNYIESDSQENTAYQFGHDSIQIVSFIIGIFQFVKSVASFASFIKKAITYLKRFGRKAINDLKGLNSRQLKDVFDRLETGSGGFYRYKKILSRDMVKQEEWMSCAAACVKRYADDLGIKITESEIRLLAKTTESGTDGKDLFLAMRKIFKDEEVFAKSYFDDIDDIINFENMIVDTGSKSFITNIGRFPNKHTIIIDKITGNNVHIRDPWPLEVDKAFEKGIRGVELEKIFEQSNNGVEAILELNEFKNLWAQGGNIMFKII